LGRSRRARGGLFAAALSFLVDWRLRHEPPVDDRVRVAPTLDVWWESPDRRVDGVGGGLLGVEVAYRALLAVRVAVFRQPPSPIKNQSKAIFKIYRRATGRGANQRVVTRQPVSRVLRDGPLLCRRRKRTRSRCFCSC
jgi:hypothetical protein